MKENEFTIHEASAKLKSGELKSADLTEACFDRIEEVDEKTKAFITLTKDAALKQAKAQDTTGNKQSILSGIPVAIKDIICTKNVKTTAASNILKKLCSAL